MLKTRKECNTYLTHVCRHHSSRDSHVKRLKYKELQQTLWLSSAVDIDSMSTDAESNSVGWSFLYFNLFTWLSLLLWCLQTWVRQVSHLSLLFNIFLSYVNRFTLLCKNLFNLLEFLAEAFRSHVHNFQFLMVPVELAAMVCFPVHGCWDSRDVGALDSVKECMWFVMYLII